MLKLENCNGEYLIFKNTLTSQNFRSARSRLYLMLLSFCLWLILKMIKSIELVNFDIDSDRTLVGAFKSHCLNSSFFLIRGF